MGCGNDQTFVIIIRSITLLEVYWIYLVIGVIIQKLFCHYNYALHV